MKQFLIICIALTSQFTLFAQDDEYHPLIRDGFTWDVLESQGTAICDWTSGGRYFFGSDTTINGQVYKNIESFTIVSEFDEVYCEPFYVDLNTTSSGIWFIREDIENRKVYIRDFSSEEEEEVLYDFSLVEGETFTSYGEQPQVIDSIRTVTLENGEERKIFYLPFEQFYIEGIGGCQGVQFPLIQGIGFAYVPRCYYENSELIWTGGDNSSCFGILSIEDTQRENTLSVFPNPAVSEIWLEFDDNRGAHTYKVFDLAGKSRVEGQIIQANQSLDISKLPTGVYMIQLSNDQGVSASQKFVKTSD